MTYTIHLIGILGKKKHGKSTASNHLVIKCGYLELAIADVLKEGIKIWFGLTNDQVYGDKKEIIDEYWKVTPRFLLQKFGTDIGRDYVSKIMPSHVGKNLWIMNLEKKYLQLKKNNKDIKIVISDIRYQNEIDFIRKHGGIIIKILRPNFTDNGDISYKLHKSETTIDKINDFDELLLNDKTIEDLKYKLNLLLKKYQK